MGLNRSAETKKKKKSSSEFRIQNSEGGLVRPNDFVIVSHSPLLPFASAAPLHVINKY